MPCTRPVFAYMMSRTTPVGIWIQVPWEKLLLLLATVDSVVQGRETPIVLLLFSMVIFVELNSGTGTMSGNWSLIFSLKIENKQKIKNRKRGNKWIQIVFILAAVWSTKLVLCVALCRLHYFGWSILQSSSGIKFIMKEEMVASIIETWGINGNLFSVNNWQTLI